MLINLIMSELAISCIGVPLDLLGVVTNGEELDDVLCPIVAFTHTFFGNRYTFS